MLNLQVAMISKIFNLILLAPVLISAYFQQTSAVLPRVDVPYEGDTVRGVVGIAGTTNIDGFMLPKCSSGSVQTVNGFPLGNRKILSATRSLPIGIRQ